MKKTNLLFFRLENFFFLCDRAKGNLIFPLTIEDISETKADVVANGPAPSP